LYFYSFVFLIFGKVSSIGVRDRNGGSMKRIVSVIFSVFMVIVFASMVAAATCQTIQSGALLNSAGETIETGFDIWGYNYQARLFNGTYCDAYRDAAWCQPWANDELAMKWNDAWLSNQDCDGDGKLDRHLGFASYIGSGAWLTNHQKGTYLDGNGKRQRWEYFVKIVAAPSDAIQSGGIVYAADGSEIGPVIWGEFAVIQEVYNDTGTGNHGVLYLSPYSAGFGKYSPQD